MRDFQKQHPALAEAGDTLLSLLSGPFALAAIALAAASMLFSFFMSRSTRYSLIYGSLASVIILLVWLYLCGNILILGSAFNYVLDDHRHRKENP